MTIPITLITPYANPAGTFRASGITDMVRIVPVPRKYWNELDVAGASFKFNVGLDPDIRSLIFTVQNRTVSHVLGIELTLPPYLRSDLGSSFNVPPRGDTVTPPVAVVPTVVGDLIRGDWSIIETDVLVGGSRYSGAGKGIINVYISFNEAQVGTLDPAIYNDEIVFTVTPLNVNGPVFVDANAEDPIDLNEFVDDETENIPRDDDKIPGRDEKVVEVPVFIPEEVEVEVEVLKWIDGTDGQTKDWPPPEGWTVEADGRMYPPILEPKGDCEVVTGTERDPETIPEDQRTPLEQLLVESKDTSPSFGANTLRRGYVVDVDQYLAGHSTNRVTRRTILYIIADAISGDQKFKIINYAKTFIDGSPVPNPATNEEMTIFFEKTNLYTRYVKEGTLVPGFPLRFDPLMSRRVRNAVEEGTKLQVAADADEDELKRLRYMSTSVALVNNIATNGEGTKVS